MKKSIFIKLSYLFLIAIIFYLVIAWLGFKTENSIGYDRVVGDWRFKQVVISMAMPYFFLAVYIAVRKIDSFSSMIKMAAWQAALLFVARCILLGIYASIGMPDAKVVVVTATIFSLIICYIQFFFMERGWISRGPRVLFSILAVPSLLLYLSLSLPTSIPDSYSHIVSAYRYSNFLLGYKENDGYVMQAEDYAFLSSISDGYEFGVTTQPNFALYETELDGLLTKRADGLKDVMVDVIGYDHMAYYSPLCWLPQIIGITLGRIIGFNPMMLFFFARLMCGLLYFIVCLEAIRVTPIGKYAFCGLALFPLCLNTAVSFNYDSMVIISVIGFLANSFRVKYAANDSQISLFVTVKSIIYAFLLGGVKGGGYLLLILLGVIWSRKTYSIIRSVLVLATGIFSYVLFNKILPAGMQYFQLEPLSDVTMSADYSIHYPIRYLSRIINMYFCQLQNLLDTLIGVKNTPNILVWGTVISVVALILLNNDCGSVGRADQRVMRLLVIVGIIVTPATILVGNVPEVFILKGVQGRYFLPMALLGLILLGKRCASVDFDKIMGKYPAKRILLLCEMLSVIYSFLIG